MGETTILDFFKNKKINYSLILMIVFLLFGFLIETHEILNIETALWAVGIVCGIMIFRIIQLKISGYPMFPLLFVAPRGLISILLFLSIAPERSIQIVNKPMMIQVVILTALIMMFGLMMTKKIKKEIENNADYLPLNCCKESEKK